MRFRGASTESRIEILALVILLGLIATGLRPDLIFLDTIPTGGDTPGHYYTAWYVSEHPFAWFTRWTQDWFAGFPILRFYFPLPFVLSALLSVVMPLTVALKLVLLSGLIALPLSAYIFFKKLEFGGRTAVLAALFTTRLVYLRGYDNFGANELSALRGEFAYGIGMAFALLFFGYTYTALTKDKGHLLPILLLAGTVLSHLVPAVLVFVSAPCLLLAVGLDKRRSLLKIYAVAIALTAFWWLPFIAGLANTSDSGLTKYGLSWVLPSELAPYLVALPAAAIVGLVSRDKRAFLLMGPPFAALVIFLVLGEGQVRNTRFLPFWYLGILLAAAWSTGSVVEAVAARWGRRALISAAALTLVLLMVVIPSWTARKEGVAGRRIALALAGVERAPSGEDYKHLVKMFHSLPAGRIMTEGSFPPDILGSDLALSILPTQTSHDFLSGVNRQATPLAPYILTTALEMSSSHYLPPENRTTALGTVHDISSGIEHLRTLGVSYFVAVSTDVADAIRRRGLTIEGTAGPFTIFQVPSELVTSVNAVYSEMMKEDWVDTNLRWFADGEQLDHPYVLGMPPTQETLLPAEVSDVRITDSYLSFKTDSPGVPHLIRLSFDRAWRSQGADGPWRASPNFMVVVPTEHDVKLYRGITLDVFAGGVLSSGVVLLYLALRICHRSRIPVKAFRRGGR